MLILRYLFQQIAKLLALRDTRLQHLPFTSVESLIVIITLYLLFILKWGPKFMERRKPYDIEKILLFYNGVQMIANFSILFYTIYQINTTPMQRNVNFMCEELDFTESAVGIKSAVMSYCYFLVKILDLLDTIFFVLRKRTRQISFLHVYHHVAILMGAYIAVSWAPGGHPWLFGLLNCFVHLIMYGYYFGSVYRPQLKTNITIKRSITQLQIVQFVLSIIHLSIPFFIDGCNYPRVFLVIAISQNMIMLLLFSDFYYNAYIKSNRIKTRTS